MHGAIRVDARSTGGDVVPAQGLSMLESWTIDPWLIAWLALPALLYLRGALGMRRRRGAARTAAFLAGLAVIWTALASPLEAFAPLMLSAHMGQHLLLTMVAPPLLLLGEPMVPLLRGVPSAIRREWLAPFLAAPRLRRAMRRLVHPLVAGPLFVLAMFAWHVPSLYELALREPAWHRVEHACFLVTAVLFWWPVVGPAPSRAWWPRWALVPYLLVADVANTVLSAILCFAPGVLYATYANASSAIGVDALADQARAGAIMWIPGSIAYLVPAAWIVVRAMRPARLVPGGSRRVARESERVAGHEAPSSREREEARSVSLPQLAVRRDARRRFDLLRVPLLGALLSRRSIRTALRVAMLMGAIAVVVDGFSGPEEAPMNLAGTLPWTHWRGATVLLLLVGGNFLCMACPFVLPRMAARRFARASARRESPRAERAERAPGSASRALAAAAPLLRSKWLAVGVLVAWLVVYEAFDLWASPWATALLVACYFGAAVLVDSLARSGAFCKWVCPLGQFHFVQSTLSPLTVAARDPGVCATCTTHDCLRGNSRADGCALDLFVPRKQGNLDCTFCLDCADACPHGNVGVLTSSIGGELRSDAWRSSLGRPSRRADLSAVAIVLSAGAIVNAAGMTAPMLDLIARSAAALSMPRWVAASALVAGSIGAIAALAALAAAPGRGWSRRFAAVGLAMAPLGAAMWLVHFSFHLVTSWTTAWPVSVRAVRDLGVGTMEPAWSDSCCTNPPEWLLPASLLALSLGLSLSIWTLARRCASHAGAASAVAAAESRVTRIAVRLLGSLLLVALWAIAAWVLFQPMEMRGTLGWEVAP